MEQYNLTYFYEFIADEIPNVMQATCIRHTGAMYKVG